MVDFVTTIAPGLRDVLLTGKATEAVRRKDTAEGATYDAVVMDAPPTGRISRFLNVTSEVSGLAKVGPIRGHADTVLKVIRAPETAVHFVTAAGGDAGAGNAGRHRGAARAGGIRLGAIIVNMARPLALPPDQLRAAGRRRTRPAELSLGLKAAGLDDGPVLAGALAAELHRAGRTALGQAEQQERLDAPGSSAISCRGSAAEWTWPGCTAGGSAARAEGRR